MIPQISVVLGAAAGGAAYGPALTDIVILGPEGRVFVTGPGRRALGHRRGRRHAAPRRPRDPRPPLRRRARRRRDRARARSTRRRRIATLLGSQGEFGTGRRTSTSPACCPSPRKRAYDVHPLVEGMLDEGPASSCTRAGRPNIMTTLGRLGGRTVGVIANNPLRLGGCLDSSSAEKAARFVRMCDAFGVPLVVLVDVPGYLPGVGQEWDGVVRRGAKLLHAFAECVVPRVTVVTRKAYGGAYIAMNSRALGATRVFAWPDAKVAVMGSVAAVRVLHRRRLAEVPDEMRAQLETELAEEHELLAGGLDKATSLGFVDEVISPQLTRSAVARAISQLTRRPGSARQHPTLSLVVPAGPSRRQARPRRRLPAAVRRC